MHTQILKYFSRDRNLDNTPGLKSVESLEDIKEGVTLCHVSNHGQDVNFVENQSIDKV